MCKVLLGRDSVHVALPLINGSRIGAHYVNAAFRFYLVPWLRGFAQMSGYCKLQSRDFGLKADMRTEALIRQESLLISDGTRPFGIFYFPSYPNDRKWEPELKSPDKQAIPKLFDAPIDFIPAFEEMHIAVEKAHQKRSGDSSLDSAALNKPLIPDELKKSGFLHVNQIKRLMSIVLEIRVYKREQKLRMQSRKLTSRLCPVERGTLIDKAQNALMEEDALLINSIEEKVLHQVQWGVLLALRNEIERYLGHIIGVKFSGDGLLLRRLFHYPKYIRISQKMIEKVAMRFTAFSPSACVYAMREHAYLASLMYQIRGQMTNTMDFPFRCEYESLFSATGQGNVKAAKFAALIVNEFSGYEFGMIGNTLLRRAVINIKDLSLEQLARLAYESTNKYLISVSRIDSKSLVGIVTSGDEQFSSMRRQETEDCASSGKYKLFEDSIDAFFGKLESHLMEERSGAWGQTPTFLFLIAFARRPRIFKRIGSALEEQIYDLLSSHGGLGTFGMKSQSIAGLLHACSVLLVPESVEPLHVTSPGLKSQTTNKAYNDRKFTKKVELQWSQRQVSLISELVNNFIKARHLWKTKDVVITISALARAMVFHEKFDSALTEWLPEYISTISVRDLSLLANSFVRMGYPWTRFLPAVFKEACMSGVNHGNYARLFSRQLMQMITPLDCRQITLNFVCPSDQKTNQLSTSSTKVLNLIAAPTISLLSYSIAKGNQLIWEGFSGTENSISSFDASSSFRNTSACSRFVDVSAAGHVMAKTFDEHIDFPPLLTMEVLSLYLCLLRQLNAVAVKFSSSEMANACKAAEEFLEFGMMIKQSLAIAEDFVVTEGNENVEKFNYQITIILRVLFCEAKKFRSATIAWVNMANKGKHQLQASEVRALQTENTASVIRLPVYDYNVFRLTALWHKVSSYRLTESVVELLKIISFVAYLQSSGSYHGDRSAVLSLIRHHWNLLSQLRYSELLHMENSVKTMHLHDEDLSDHILFLLKRTTKRWGL